MIALVQERLNSSGGDQLGDDEEFKPSARFDQFFQRDIDLVNEIRAALTNTALVVVRRGTSPAADKLARHMPPQPCFWNSIHDLSNACREIPEPRDQAET